MKIAAGILMYKKTPDLQVFLVHFGGPFWAKKDNGAWHIPKGLVDPGEELLAAAKRELQEETGTVIATPAAAVGKQSFIDLGFTEYNSKQVYCFAIEHGLPNNYIFKSNLTPNGWPENDRGQFFAIDEVKLKIFPAQKIFLDRLLAKFLAV
ncbi:MAG: NUDIX domain-containing protein [bacterium]|nr:NUDIX domain-containing protein [bacterium]